jgi:hypothetical protein
MTSLYTGCIILTLINTLMIHLYHFDAIISGEITKRSFPGFSAPPAAIAGNIIPYIIRN